MRSGSTIVLPQNVAARRIGPAPIAKATTEQPFEPGTRLDRYLVLERLGGGGMGQVYRARDTELDRDVALKILARPHCQDPEILNRFRAEAQAQARLRSPHVCTLYSMLELPFAAMLVLEYMEGETLEHRLRVGGPLSPNNAIAIFEQALIGLTHIHQMGIIHRDLKPSNLFITLTRQVKIMDFSVARQSARDAYPPRTMVGTLLYISPEQISGRAIDERSDIYALGVSLYESITGRLPFERASDYGLMHAHVQEQPKRPRELVPSLPPGLERVILKAIEKEPAQRYRNAEEFRSALLRHGDASAHTVSLPANAYGPIPLPSPGRSGRRVLTGLGLDLLLIAAICGVLYVLGLYPGQTAPANPAIAVIAPTPPPRAAAPAKPKPKAPAAKSADNNRDPYNALKKAWGE